MTAASPVTAPRIKSHGYFCWHELMTKDTNASQDFYTVVAGWNAQKMPMPGMDYTVFQTGAQGMAGMMGMPDDAAAMGAPSQWVGYVAVTDIAATIAEAVQRGGSVYHEPTTVPTVGTFALLADPWGAAFAVLQPERNGDLVPPAPIPGDFAWNELYADDPEGAIAFYQALFGWDLQYSHDMGPEGKYHLLGLNGRQFVGLWKRPQQVGKSKWLSYIAVADVDAAVKSAKAQGGQVLVEPMEVPGGARVAQVVDNVGAHIALHWGRAS
ncbi:MAG: VOC family protein [Deltaproteobacteria bacterium]|nr:VOC family protein [Deltaproteobacteria bacterium]